ncbi:hypothetical protein ACROYT_G003537 [Oculina patagonica]
MVRILARRSRAKIPMARPNEPDMQPKCTKKALFILSSAANMLAELSHQVLLGFTALKFTILVGLLRIASSIPYLKERIQKYEEHYLLVPYQDFWDDYGSNKMLSAVLKIMLGDLNKTARLGNAAPNCRLVTTNEKECRLLDFARGSRPLVVNFGSYS